MSNMLRTMIISLTVLGFIGCGGGSGSSSNNGGGSGGNGSSSNSGSTDGTTTNEGGSKPIGQSIVYKTGQTKSYNEDGVEVTDGSLKDDGYYQKGLDTNFTKNGDILIDNIAKLQWQNNEDVKLKVNSWSKAGSYCSNLTLGTYSDLRLPTKKELDSKIVFTKPSAPSLGFNIDPVFLNNSVFDTILAWSSETIQGDASLTWIGGSFGTQDKLDQYNPHTVSCVRAGQSGIFNATCKRNTDDTVSCNNGLIWQDNAEVDSTKKTWKEAINYCENLDFAGHDDWRLPNFNELISLVSYSHYKVFNSAFKNVSWDTQHTVQRYNYWSSTSASSDERLAIHVGALYDTIDQAYKNAETLNVRCVRAGK